MADPSISATPSTRHTGDRYMGLAVFIVLDETSPPGRKLLRSLDLVATPPQPRPESTK